MSKLKDQKMTNNKYLAKIIASDRDGLQLISAFCMGAEIKVADIKYLKKNKLFLLSLLRKKNESENSNKKINGSSSAYFNFITYNLI